MSRVDFYVLGASGLRARQHFACRLAEKAWQQNNAVYIRVSDLEAARNLDDILIAPVSWRGQDYDAAARNVESMRHAAHRLDRLRVVTVIENRLEGVLIADVHPPWGLEVRRVKSL